MNNDRLRALVNNQVAWEILEEYIDDRLETYYKFLVNEEDPTKLYKTQGKIRELLDLKHTKKRLAR